MKPQVHWIQDHRKLEISASEKGTGSRARPYFHSCHGTHGSLGPNTPKPRAEKSWGKPPWIFTTKAT